MLPSGVEKNQLPQDRPGSCPSSSDVTSEPLEFPEWQMCSLIGDPRWASESFRYREGAGGWPAVQTNQLCDWTLGALGHRTSASLVGCTS